MKHYPAPWSRMLIVMSAVVTVVCLGTTLITVSVSGTAPWLWSTTNGGYGGWLGWLGLLPVLLLGGCALFTIRGYTIMPEAILVRRLLWSTRLPRADLQLAHCDPDAMRGSIRTFGNGGAFSFSGFYYNKLLGSYRALVTDPRRAVVLRYARRIVVVSPETPEAFARELSLSAT